MNSGITGVASLRLVSFGSRIYDLKQPKALTISSSSQQFFTFRWKNFAIFLIILTRLSQFYDSDTNSEINLINFILLTVNVGYLVVSVAITWSTVNRPKFMDADQSPLGYALTITQFSWIGSIFTLGLLFGGFGFAPIPKLFGRKSCLILGCLTVVFSWLFLTFGSSLAMILVARFLVGFGASGIGVAKIMYISEVSSAQIRGLSLTFSMTLFALGTLFVYILAPFISYKGSCYLGLSVTLLYVIPMTWMPESPVYLLIKGRRPDAKTSVISLRRCSEEEAEMILDEMQATIDVNKIKGTADFSQLYRVKANRKALFITGTLWLLHLFSGSGFLETFSLSLINISSSQYVPLIIIGVIKLVSAATTPFLVDRVGRKPLLIVSSAVCGFCLIFFGIYFFLDNKDSPKAECLEWLPLASIVTYFLFYGLGLSVIPTILIGELLDINIKGIGSALVHTVGYIFSFLIGSMYGYLTVAIGTHGVFWFFSIFCIACALFTVFFVPETKVRTLKEIQELLNK